GIPTAAASWCCAERVVAAAALPWLADSRLPGLLSPLSRAASARRTGSRRLHLGRVDKRPLVVMTAPVVEAYGLVFAFAHHSDNAADAAGQGRASPRDRAAGYRRGRSASSGTDRRRCSAAAGRRAYVART